MPQSLGAACRILGRISQKAGGKLLHCIIRLRGVQVIGSQSRVKSEGIGVETHIVQLVEGGFQIVADAVLALFQEAVQIHGFHRCQLAHALFPGDTDAAILVDIERETVTGIRKAVANRQFFCAGSGRLRLFPVAPQTVFVDQADKLQLYEQIVKGTAVIGCDQRILRGKVDGGIGADGSKVIGKICHFLAVFQLFTQFGTDGGIGEILVDTVQAAELQEKFRSSLGTHTGNTGNIIG